MAELMGFDEDKKKNETDISEEQQFITEKIVSKRKKRWLRRLITFLFVILCAIVFGVVARYFFLISGDALVQIFGIEIPVIREQVYVYTEKTPSPSPRPSVTPIVGKLTGTARPTITITPTVTVTPVTVAQNTPVLTAPPSVTPDTAEVSATPTPVVSSGNNDPDVTPTPEAGDDPGKEKQDEKPVYSYVKFMEEVMQVTESVSGIIVSVDGITTGVNFFGETYQYRTNTTGLVVAQDGVDVLILTDYTSIEDASSVEVTFAENEKVFPGEVYNYDKDLGLAVIGVSILSLDEGMLENMQYAKTGKEENVALGSPVFELGRANGYPDSLSFGIISSVGNKLAVKDAEINYFTTDWQNYSGASGFVFDMDGNVLGMLTHSVDTNQDQTILPCFIALYTLDDELNLLFNGGTLVNFGIYAREFSRVIKETGAVEYGLYLDQVMAASPAYEAGLRVGDVITAINGTELTDMSVFMDILSASSAQQAVNVTYIRNYASGTREMSAYVVLKGK